MVYLCLFVLDSSRFAVSERIQILKSESATHAFFFWISKASECSELQNVSDGNYKIL